MFEGFSPQTVDFLWGIRFNNERSWFEAHKTDYQTYLLAPMKELAADVQAEMAERFAKVQLNVRVSRIYRDARRLFGRGPYKDHLWFSMYRWDKDDGSRPVFWFELAPDNWSYGMGFWMAPAATMAKHRARIDHNYKPMLTLAHRLAKQDTFELEGPEYARRKEPPHKDLVSWYNKKSLSIGCSNSLSEELYDPSLVTLLADGFTFLMPYYDYFSTLWADGEPTGN